jgi:L-asparaginase/Glu-tRNA(Gln) amidotransferase subunit D
MVNLPAGQRDQSAEGRSQEASMNHSIYSADRSTHLKIVVVALVAGVVVAGFGISARSVPDDGYTQTARVIKAGKPVAVTSSTVSVVR